MSSQPRLLPGLKKLILLSISLALPQILLAQDAIELENTSWQLIEIHSAADSVFVPRNPESYLLRFRLDRRLQIEADCNQAGATYNVNGMELSLTDLVSTRKLCVSPTLFNRYILNLTRAQSIRMDGENLIVQSDIETDWMLFEPYVFVPRVPN